MKLKDALRKDISLMLSSMRRFYNAYDMWFVLYADPLSDEIVSDIQHQAETWAWQQVRAYGTR